MEVLLASGNAHKAEELNELFAGSGIIVSAAPEKLEVVEDGATYEENAFKKAEAYYQKFNRPVVSDDSGLNVVALPDELGIYSARFGGEDLAQEDKNKLLLSKLEGKEGADRDAYFTCVLCFYLGKDEVFFFEGRVDGEIGLKPLGDGGFGYDPIFMPAKLKGEKSLAEVGNWKKSNSHRACAALSAQKFFTERE
ncbi:MAG: non-canonical purine NTP pyrophosphatase [Bacteriovoracaceae bacterium]|nr:non-canonical purine NTP pyrophosphatase [Bacteriovoracaceae bacterium]